MDALTQNSEVAESYLDVWGNEKRIDPATREALTRALGPMRKPARVKLEAGRCYEPELLAQGARVWGFMVQLYGVRSKRNWGIGDFGDLKALVEFAASRGAAVVGVNPLHATQGSPYSPSSRLALNFLYLDVEAIPEFGAGAAAQRLVKTKAFQRKLADLRKAPLVDYAGVAVLKRHVLERIFRDAGPKVAEPSTFAIFEALREKLGGGWESWPREYRDPHSRAVRKFAKKNAPRVAFHEWVQRAARAQLEGVQVHAQRLGMPIGLYVDLALGADRGGAEVWADREAYALEATCGAPPDEFNPKGQDWGLPPYSPRALRACAYGPFIELLRANMPAGGALRMDHVMALSRLYWIPRGAKADRGGYVHYPADDLLAVLAAESSARKCLVIGEDLGTVSAELRTKLNRAGVLSYRPLLFEKAPDGEMAPPEAYPRDALVCVSTHDLPTWRGYWVEHDLELRDRLGLTVDKKKERALRRADVERLKRAGLNPDARPRCDLSFPVPRQVPLRRRDQAGAVPRQARHQPSICIAVPEGATGQHARLRHHRPQRGESGDRHRARVAHPAGHAQAPRHGPGARPRAEPHGRAARRQRLVARRSGERSRVAVCSLLRHRLEPRQAAAAGARQTLRRGARKGGTQAREPGRTLERALLRPPLPAQPEDRAQPQADPGSDGTPSAARAPALSPGVLARGLRRDQLPALLRDHRPRRHPRRGQDGVRGDARSHLPAGQARRHRRPAHRPSGRPGRPAGVPRAAERDLRAAVGGGGEDPRRLRAAARGLADPWHHRLSLRQRALGRVHRPGGRAAVRPRLPALQRRARPLRGDLGREPLSHHEHDARRRAPDAVQLACAHRRRQPLHARLHRERPAQGARRDRGALPGVPHLRQPARHRGLGSQMDRLGDQGGEARQPRRRSRRVRLRPRRADARRSAAQGPAPAGDAALRHALPAVHRAGGGEGRRGHRVLSLQPLHRAQRGGRPSGALRHDAEGIPCRERGPRQALVHHHPRQLDARHQAL